MALTKRNRVQTVFGGGGQVVIPWSRFKHGINLSQQRIKPQEYLQWPTLLNLLDSLGLG